ncbi:MAG: PilT/PilU family type 4a pilus ATPase, partial [Candidatus Sumerlaeota bacterium]|nr:PilT/PilU family type 4a pilus ATPase [Candidatus Sumerlaeota bacterium]
RDQIEAVLVIQKSLRGILGKRTPPKPDAAADEAPVVEEEEPRSIVGFPGMAELENGAGAAIYTSPVARGAAPAPPGADALPDSLGLETEAKAEAESAEKDKGGAFDFEEPPLPSATTRVAPPPAKAAPPASAPVPAAPASAAPAPAAPEPAEAPEPRTRRPATLERISAYLTFARGSHASDLHISAGVSPFLRLHGLVYDFGVPPMSPEESERLLFEILSVEQKRELLQKLNIEFCMEVPKQGRIRVLIYKQRCGWHGVFHLIRRAIPTLEDLGMPEPLRRLTEYNQGLVLVTGPANSGKTTTLAALVNAINESRSDHIITIERPIEYIHTSKKCQVTQREVGTHTRSFAIALRAALREDPDVIMVGELHDLETLSMAIAASETGHLVLGTLHTSSAASTVSRILDGFPPGQQAQVRMMLTQSLRGVISQQLVPCKDRRGVALAIEIMLVTPAIAALLRDNKPFMIPATMQSSRKIGMCRLDDSLMDLFNKGIIDGAEAYRRAVNKQAFERYKAPTPGR